MEVGLRGRLAILVLGFALMIVGAIGAGLLTTNPGCVAPYYLGNCTAAPLSALAWFFISLALAGFLLLAGFGVWISARRGAEARTR